MWVSGAAAAQLPPQDRALHLRTFRVAEDPAPAKKPSRKSGGSGRADRRKQVFRDARDARGAGVPAGAPAAAPGRRVQGSLHLFAPARVPGASAVAGALQVEPPASPNRAEVVAATRAGPSWLEPQPLRQLLGPVVSQAPVVAAAGVADSLWRTPGIHARVLGGQAAAPSAARLPPPAQLPASAFAAAVAAPALASAAATAAAASGSRRVITTIVAPGGTQRERLPRVPSPPPPPRAQSPPTLPQPAAAPVQIVQPRQRHVVPPCLPAGNLGVSGATRHIDAAGPGTSNVRGVKHVNSNNKNILSLPAGARKSVVAAPCEPLYAPLRGGHTGFAPARGPPLAASVDAAAQEPQAPRPAALRVVSKDRSGNVGPALSHCNVRRSTLHRLPDRQLPPPPAAAGGVYPVNAAAPGPPLPPRGPPAPQLLAAQTPFTSPLMLPSSAWPPAGEGWGHRPHPEPDACPAYPELSRSTSPRPFREAAPFAPAPAMFRRGLPNLSVGRESVESTDCPTAAVIPSFSRESLPPRMTTTISAAKSLEVAPNRLIASPGVTRASIPAVGARAVPESPESDFCDARRLLPLSDAQTAPRSIHPWYLAPDALVAGAGVFPSGTSAPQTVSTAKKKRRSTSAPLAAAAGQANSDAGKVGTDPRTQASKRVLKSRRRPATAPSGAVPGRTDAGAEVPTADVADGNSGGVAPSTTAAAPPLLGQGAKSKGDQPRREESKRITERVRRRRRASRDVVEPLTTVPPPLPSGPLAPVPARGASGGGGKTSMPPAPPSRPPSAAEFSPQKKLHARRKKERRPAGGREVATEGAIVEKAAPSGSRSKDATGFQEDASGRKRSAAPASRRPLAEKRHLVGESRIFPSTFPSDYPVDCSFPVGRPPAGATFDYRLVSDAADRESADRGVVGVSESSEASAAEGGALRGTTAKETNSLAPGGQLEPSDACPNDGSSQRWVVVPADVFDKLSSRRHRRRRPRYTNRDGGKNENYVAPSSDVQRCPCCAQNRLCDAYDDNFAAHQPSGRQGCSNRTDGFHSDGRGAVDSSPLGSNLPGFGMDGAYADPYLPIDLPGRGAAVGQMETGPQKVAGAAAAPASSSDSESESVYFRLVAAPSPAPPAMLGIPRPEEAPTLAHVAAGTAAVGMGSPSHETLSAISEEASNYEVTPRLFVGSSDKSPQIDLANFLMGIVPTSAERDEATGGGLHRAEGASVTASVATAENTACFTATTGTTRTSNEEEENESPRLLFPCTYSPSVSADVHESSDAQHVEASATQPPPAASAKRTFPLAVLPGEPRSRVDSQRSSDDEETGGGSHPGGFLTPTDPLARPVDDPDFFQYRQYDGDRRLRPPRKGGGSDDGRGGDCATPLALASPDGVTPSTPPYKGASPTSAGSTGLDAEVCAATAGAAAEGSLRESTAAAAAGEDSDVDGEQPLFSPLDGSSRGQGRGSKDGSVVPITRRNGESSTPSTTVDSTTSHDVAATGTPLAAGPVTDVPLRAGAEEPREEMQLEIDSSEELRFDSEKLFEPSPLTNSPAVSSEKTESEDELQRTTIVVSLETPPEKVASTPGTAPAAVASAATAGLSEAEGAPLRLDRSEELRLIAGSYEPSLLPSTSPSPALEDELDDAVAVIPGGATQSGALKEGGEGVGDSLVLAANTGGVRDPLWLLGTVCGPHVVQLDVDDTLLPTTELCERNWLDKEVHELPATYRQKLRALDRQLTRFFDMLHRMVIQEVVVPPRQTSPPPEVVESEKHAESGAQCESGPAPAGCPGTVGNPAVNNLAQSECSAESPRHTEVRSSTPRASAAACTPVRATKPGTPRGVSRILPAATSTGTGPTRGSESSGRSEPARPEFDTLENIACEGPAPSGTFQTPAAAAVSGENAATPTIAALGTSRSTRPATPKSNGRCNNGPSNYLLSVVIISNATMTHIRSIFPRFFPVLTAFFKSRQIALEDLVCSARDLWGDEFPFEHFYDFWKCWTLEDVLAQLRLDGVQGLTVLSIGDDEPERRAAGYVRQEMPALVHGLKVIKMTNRPTIDTLSLELEYIIANFKGYIASNSTFDVFYDVQAPAALPAVVLDDDNDEADCVRVDESAVKCGPPLIQDASISDDCAQNIDDVLQAVARKIARANAAAADVLFEPLRQIVGANFDDGVAELEDDNFAQDDTTPQDAHPVPTACDETALSTAAFAHLQGEAPSADEETAPANWALKEVAQPLSPDVPNPFEAALIQFELKFEQFVALFLSFDETRSVALDSSPDPGNNADGTGESHGETGADDGCTRRLQKMEDGPSMYQFLYMYLSEVRKTRTAKDLALLMRDARSLINIADGRMGAKTGKSMKPASLNGTVGTPPGDLSRETENVEDDRMSQRGSGADPSINPFQHLPPAQAAELLFGLLREVLRFLLLYPSMLIDYAHPTHQAITLKTFRTLADVLAAITHCEDKAISKLTACAASARETCDAAAAADQSRAADVTLTKVIETLPV